MEKQDDLISLTTKVSVPMSKDYLSKAIERLEAIDPLGEFAYEDAVSAFLNIKGLPVLFFEIQAGQRICRTRTHESQDMFTKVSDISTPPVKVVSAFARCNRPFQTKFYGSENRQTSFFELVEYWAETKNIGNKILVTIGLWFTKTPLTTLIVTSPHPDKRTSEFDKSHGAALDRFISEQQEETKEAVTLFYEFLFERFRKPAKHDPLTYIITSAYCNVAMLYGKRQGIVTQAVMYPSVPFGGQGVNFAISSDYIKPENIELNEVMCNELTISENKSLKYNFTETNKWQVKKINQIGNTLVW